MSGFPASEADGTVHLRPKSQTDWRVPSSAKERGGTLYILWSRFSSFGCRTRAVDTFLPNGLSFCLPLFFLSVFFVSQRWSGLYKSHAAFFGLDNPSTGLPTMDNSSTLPPPMRFLHPDCKTYAAQHGATPRRLWRSSNPCTSAVPSGFFTGIHPLLNWAWFTGHRISPLTPKNYLPLS
jgi:hypothetical protein